MAQVVERFRRADTGFLMSGAALATDPIIDISHESLIRLWDLLRGWVDAEARAGQRIRRLVDLALEHRDHDGPRLEGRSLAEAVEWAEQQRPTPAWVGLYLGAARGEEAWAAVRYYLDESRGAQQRKQLEAQAEEQRRLTETRRRKAIAITAVISVVAVSLVIGAAGFHLAKLAKSRELLSQALREKERNPARAAHLALAASELDSNNSSAIFALRDALVVLEHAYVESILPIDVRIDDMRYSPDRSRLLLISGDTVYIRDAQKFQTMGQPIRRTRNIKDARLTGDNSTLVTMTDDYKVQLQRLDGGAEMPLACPGEGNAVYKVEVASTDARVALGCYNGEVLVWDAAGGSVRQTHTFTHSGKAAVATSALAFSDDGMRLASGDTEGAINVWRLDRPPDPAGRAWLGQSLPGERDSPLKHDLRVASLEFLAGSHELLVSASDDKTAKVWQLAEVQPTGSGIPSAGAMEKSWTLAVGRAVIAAKFMRSQGNDQPVLTLSRVVDQRHAQAAASASYWRVSCCPSR